MITKKEEQLDLSLIQKHIDLAKANPLKSGTKKQGYRKPTASPSLDKFLSKLSKGAIKTNTEYWDSLTIKNDFEYFQRWVFAICSVHTTWESNVKGYNLLMSDLSWTISKKRLEEIIHKSGLGMHTRRIKGLWQLVEGFRYNPKEFYKSDLENWEEARNRLVGRIFGLGYAKTTFAITLSFPTQAKLVCLDVHILRFMGYDRDGTPSGRFYLDMEQVWLKICRKHKVNPAVVREVYWDRVQNRMNPRYWSYCLER
jgi:thermostable 8-oxoguanine DNA glycosylase